MAVPDLADAASRDPEPFNIEGRAHIRAGNPHAAIAAFCQAVVLAPDSYEYAVCLGNALAEAGLHFLAVASYRDALRIMPGDEIATGLLAAALEQAGESQ